MSRTQKIVRLNTAQDQRGAEISDPVFVAFKEMLILRTAGNEGTFPERKIVDDDRPSRGMLLAERESLLQRIVLETQATTPAGLLAQAILLEEVHADLQSEDKWTDPNHVDKLARRQRFAIFSIINGLSDMAGIDPKSIAAWEDRKDQFDDPHALCRAVVAGVTRSTVEEEAA